MFCRTHTRKQVKINKIKKKAQCRIRILERHKRETKEKPNNSTQLLAFLNTITKNGDFESIPGNDIKNACWHSLALLLELVYPSNNTKECQPIGHHVYRGYPQAHGSIVIAFHPEVLSGYRYLYFPIGRHGSKSSSMDMSKIDIHA
jgi:hypothetical protein